MSRTLHLHTDRYAPWEEDADEPTKIHEFDEDIEIDPDEDETLAEAVHHELSQRGLTSYSSSDFDGTQGWYSDPDGYEDPYTATRDEYSAFLKDFTEDEALAVYDRTVKLKQAPLSGVNTPPDAQARVAAAQWQGPSTHRALEALASSGYIGAHTEDEIVAELRHQTPGTIEHEQLTELRNYVRKHGVRPALIGWPGLWDEEYEKRGRVAVEPSGAQVLVRPGSGWGRKEYEDLAAFISRRQDRELLGRFFAAELRDSGNAAFRPQQFIEAASTPDYQVRGGTASPKYTGGKLTFLAEATRAYEAEHGTPLAHDLIDHLQNSVPRFNPERFLAAAGKIRVPVAELRQGDQLSDGTFITEVHHDDEGTWITTDDGDEGYLGRHHTQIVTRDDTPDYDGVVRSQTSEDGPRDAVQPSAERTRSMTTSTGEVTGLSTALDHAEELKNYFPELAQKVEQFAASLSQNEVGGPVHEHLAKLQDLLAASTAAASDVYDELATRGPVADSMNAVAGAEGREDLTGGE